MNEERLGFIGLGNMGGPMCANLCAAGRTVTAYDKAGTAARAPAGADVADSVAAVSAVAPTVLLSLPDGPALATVVAEIAATPDRATRVVADLSTVGIAAAEAAAATLAPHEIAFVDAPVSGGKAGAIAATITVMCAGPDDAVARLEPAFATIAGNVFCVGARAGLGQAMKLANNFLSATAMAATSEAVQFGTTHGLDMAMMLDVLNVSTGRNSATVDKFPRRIATGSFDAGFATALLAKDVALYLDSVRAGGNADAIASTLAELWRGADAALPDSDFTEIYRYIASLAGRTRGAA